MTREIRIAFDHVREHHPAVIVVYNSAQQWQFMGEDYERIVFGPEIDVDILNDALDSLTELPAVFEHPDWIAELCSDPSERLL